MPTAPRAGAGYHHMMADSESRSESGTTVTSSTGGLPTRTRVRLPSNPCEYCSQNHDRLEYRLAPLSATRFVCQ